MSSTIGVALAGRLGLNDTLEPHLNGSSYPATFGASDRRPVICLHAGARIPVRRWPEASFRRDDSPAAETF